MIQLYMKKFYKNIVNDMIIILIIKIICFIFLIYVDDFFYYNFCLQ